MRDTPYAREIASATDGIGQSIERIYVKESGQEEIRFSYWKNGTMVIRPLDLPERELLPLFAQAIRRGVFTREFLKGLHEALYDNQTTSADEPPRTASS